MRPGQRKQFVSFFYFSRRCCCCFVYRIALQPSSSSSSSNTTSQFIFDIYSDLLFRFYCLVFGEFNFFSFFVCFRQRVRERWASKRQTEKTKTQRIMNSLTETRFPVYFSISRMAREMKKYGRHKPTAKLRTRENRDCTMFTIFRKNEWQRKRKVSKRNTAEDACRMQSLK